MINVIPLLNYKLGIEHCYACGSTKDTTNTKNYLPMACLVQILVSDATVDDAATVKPQMSLCLYCATNLAAQLYAQTRFIRKTDQDPQ